jgi:hypothetical protein
VGHIAAALQAMHIPTKQTGVFPLHSALVAQAPHVRSWLLQYGMAVLVHSELDLHWLHMPVLLEQYGVGALQSELVLHLGRSAVGMQTSSRQESPVGHSALVMHWPQVWVNGKQYGRAEVVQSEFAAHWEQMPETQRWPRAEVAQFALVVQVDVRVPVMQTPYSQFWPVGHSELMLHWRQALAVMVLVEQYGRVEPTTGAFLHSSLLTQATQEPEWQ